MEEEKSRSRKGYLDMEDDLIKNRRDRDRGKEERGLEKEKRKRRPEKVKRSGSEEEDDERDKRRHRGRERDRKRDRREGEKEIDDLKRDLKRGRKELDTTTRHGDDDNGEKEKRRRRLHEWQELLKRINHEAEAETETKWLETTESESGGDGDEDEEVIDPLDVFMNTIVLPEVEKLSNSSATSLGINDGVLESKKSGDKPKKGLGRIIQGEDSDSDYSEPNDGDDDDPSLEEDDEEFMKRVKKTKAEKFTLVDHSKIEYEPFRNNFYIEAKDISRMSQEEVNIYRYELELKVHGKDVPRPVKSWHQTGLTNRILDTIKKLNYEKPMSIQAQALPIIMSGRDCIGVAKTGSGKTLGFVLPMLRHIKDQPPVVAGDGPIGLVMAPTRELVQQIHSDIKKFAKALGIRCVPVYGGSGVAQQISNLKRGTEIVVCTPGRMIDILCTNSGKVTNLQRVTFLVMDEADRMFDMGFEPQITRIIQNIRPDRQTVLFSATFPRQVETLARKVLNKPVEIQVGGRNVVNKDITQLVEIRPESERHSRLLELLEEWYEKGKILVFVQSQEKCDALYKDLKTIFDYRCQSLHGGKDQISRETAISDFKSSVSNVLIATSVAARGLDVKELDLVVNFDAPNHYEDYVHRVGRTGRAGRKGCAVTFISEEDAKYAPDLVKALELSEQPVPDGLKAIADGFMAKVKQGTERVPRSGYHGSGFKFNEEEDEVKKAAKKAQAKEYGFEDEDKSGSEDENDVVRKAGGDISQQQQAKSSTHVTTNSNGVLPVTDPGPPSDRAGRDVAMVAAANLQRNLAKLQAAAMPEHYEAELEINDFPQNARWKVTHRDTLGRLSEWAGVAITTRGQFYAQGRIPLRGERKLYLFIEGPTETSVKEAKTELKRVLTDVTNQALSLPPRPGRYSVL